MANVLVAWEMGGGLGHVGPLRPILGELIRSGHQVTVATPSVALCQQAFADLSVRVLPAPQLPLSERRLKIPCTFTDVLHDCGYASPENVVAAVGQWGKLIDWVQPALLLADYSPTAMLAGRVRELPMATLGSGFVCPPDVSPLPSLHAQITEPHWATEVESAVLQAMNAALTAHGTDELSRVTQLYADTEHQFLFTLPELDHYPGRSGAAYRPITANLPGMRLNWSEPQRSPRLLVYLRNEPSTEPILRGLAMKGIETIAYVRNLAGGCVEALQGSNVRVVSSPLELAPLLPGCDAALLNGGHITVVELLLAGVAMMVLPLSLEQAVTGQRLVASGAGLTAAVNDLNAIGTALEELLTNQTLKQAALKIASDRRTCETEQPAKALVEELAIYLN